MSGIPEDIIQWQDREVLRRINIFFQGSNTLLLSEYAKILDEVRKPPVDIRINEEIEDEKD